MKSTRCYLLCLPMMTAVGPAYAQSETQAEPLPAPVTEQAAPAPSASPAADTGAAAASVPAAVTAEAEIKTVAVTPPSDPVAAPSRAPVRSALVEEVIVTAQKREENVSDVPIAITALSGDQLKALGVTNPYDLSNVVPGLQQTEAVGFSVAYLRGVGTDAFLMADPSVALYIDDVYLPFSMAANQKFGKLERTEVLKGPQGTLFGRNAVGGAINVVTKNPSFAGFEASTELEIGDYNKKAAKLYVNLPVFDNLALNFTALHDSRDSYYDGVMDISLADPDGRKVPGERSNGVQGKLRFQPLDWLDIGLNASVVAERGVSGLYGPNTDPSPLVGQALGIQAQKGFKGTATSADAHLDVDNQVYSGYVKAQFDAFDTKLLGSHQKIDSDNSIDFDGSVEPLVEFQVVHNRAKIDTAEFQLLSNANSWGAEKWSWILGAYYFKSDQGTSPITAEVGTTSLAANTLFGAPIPQSFTDLLLASGLAGAIPSGSVIFDGLIGTKSLAGFFQTTYHFTDEIALTLGGRYQDEDRSIIDSSSYTQNTDGSRGVLLFQSNNKDRFPDLNTSRFSPKVGLEFRPYDNFLAYASFQKATKSATYNVENIASQAQKVKAEDDTTYEIGLKSQWFGGLVKSTLAAFRYDLKNQQVQFVSLLAGGAIRFENAPKGRINGADFDILAEVFPSVVDSLYLTASGAFLDAQFTDYPMGSGFDAETGLYTQNGNYTGNTIPRSPKFSGRVGVNKIFTFDVSSLELAADIYHNDGYFTSASNIAPSKQKQYDVANLRVTYGYEPYRVKLTGYVRNLTDKEYSLSRLNNDFGVLTSLAAPRTIGMVLDWQVF